MQTKLVLKQPSALKLRFAAGATGPAGTVTVNPTTITGAPGTDASVANTGTPTAAILQFTIPRGNTGLTGDDGWSPILAVVTDGQRRVLQIADWTGGEGTKPATGSYIGPTGLVSAIGDAVDIRGAQGPSGSVTDGDKGDITVSASGSTWTIDDDTVTNAKLANMAEGAFKLRKSSGTGDPEDGTPAEARTILNLNSHGQCRLGKVSSNLVLSPLNGNKLLINGAPQTVPNAGVSIAATGLTPSTVYYIYAFMNSGTMTLEASTTGHSTDSTTGVEIKTGDATRTLVGMGYCVTGPAWATDDSSRIGCLSWFNQRPKTAYTVLSANQTVTVTSLTNLPAFETSFLSWAGVASKAIAQGPCAVSGAASGNAIITYDGNQWTPGYAGISSTGSVSLGLSAALVLPEGAHVGSVWAMRTGGTNFTIFGIGNDKASLTVEVMG